MAKRNKGDMTISFHHIWLGASQGKEDVTGLFDLFEKIKKLNDQEQSYLIGQKDHQCRIISIQDSYIFFAITTAVQGLRQDVKDFATKIYSISPLKNTQGLVDNTHGAIKIYKGENGKPDRGVLVWQESGAAQSISLKNAQSYFHEMMKRVGYPYDVLYQTEPFAPLNFLDELRLMEQVFKLDIEGSKYVLGDQFLELANRIQNLSASVNLQIDKKSSQNLKEMVMAVYEMFESKRVNDGLRLIRSLKVIGHHPVKGKNFTLDTEHPYNVVKQTVEKEPEKGVFNTHAVFEIYKILLDKPLPPVYENQV